MKTTYQITTEREVFDFLKHWAHVCGYINQNHLIETILEEWMEGKKDDSVSTGSCVVCEGTGMSQNFSDLELKNNMPCGFCAGLGSVPVKEK